MSRARFDVRTVTLPFLAALAVVVSAVPATAGRTCRDQWERVDAPEPYPGEVNRLSDVAAFSRNDVWAVGSAHENPFAFNDVPLALHWDGEGWSIVPLPEGTGDRFLEGVAGASSDDVWAVGTVGRDEPLVFHWDGASWTEVDAPGPPEGPEQVLDVDAISPSDAWAVGITGINYHKSYTLHWDGSAWSNVHFPWPGRDVELDGVAAIRSDDVWAVGSIRPSRGLTQTLTAHWDGDRWAVVESPNVPGASFTVLHGIDARATDDIWAVGSYADGDGSGSLALHWNGVRWSLHPGPPSPGSAILREAVMDRPDHLWSVGEKSVDGPDRQYFVELASDTWQEVRTDAPNGYSELKGVDSAGGVTWAVGVDYLESPADSTSDVLIDRICS